MICVKDIGHCTKEPGHGAVGFKRFKASQRVVCRYLDASLWGNCTNRWSPSTSRRNLLRWMDWNYAYPLKGFYWSRWLFVVVAGIGKLMVMIEYLQKECDRQARKVLEKFKEVREFDKKVLQRWLTHWQPVYESNSTAFLSVCLQNNVLYFKHF